jgi:hypothetical protein
LIIFQYKAYYPQKQIEIMATVTLDLSQHVEENEFSMVNNSLNKLGRNTKAAHKLGGSYGTKETLEESDESPSEDHSNSSQMSHSSEYSGSESHVENEERSRASDAQTSLQSSTKPKITEEEMERLREELGKNLQEEQMLISLQMQLLLQLKKLKASIQAAESEEGLARLASQQAKVIRLLQYDDEENNVDDEVITIQVRY